jgi:hypothetical protein
MNDQEHNGNNRMSNAEPALRPWIDPAFDRVDLKEAMSGGDMGTNDGSFPYGDIYS